MFSPLLLQVNATNIKDLSEISFKRKNSALSMQKRLGNQKLKIDCVSCASVISHFFVFAGFLCFLSFQTV